MRKGLTIALCTSWDAERFNDCRRLYGIVELAVLARIIHEAPTATAHLRTLAREIGVPLLDVL
jgi:hypothetical protein